MDYVNLGNTGLKVSRLCLGTMSFGSREWSDWVLEEKESRGFIERALQAGINFFDTADAYSNGMSEEILGRALKDMVPDREDVVIATKCYFGTIARRHAGERSPAPNRSGLSRKAVFAACDASLKRLGLDYIDLYQIHRFDVHTPFEETAEALNDLVRAGKVRYIGASSMWAWQFLNYLRLAESRGWARFVSMQNYYNLVYREEEREMIPLCRAEGVGLIPWSPMAGGFLSGNAETARAKAYAKSPNRTVRQEDDFATAARNAELAEKLGVKPMQLALAWVLANPAISAPIIGATKVHHIDDAVEALKINLSADDKKTLEEPYRPHPISGHR